MTGFPGGTSGKEPTSQCRRRKRRRFDPGLERFPGGENGNPFQYSCLKTPWTEEPGGIQSIGSHRVGHD